MSDNAEYMYDGHGDTFHGDGREGVETVLDRAEKCEPKYPDE